MNKIQVAVAVVAMGSMAVAGCQTEFVTPVVAASVMVTPQDTSVVEGDDLRFTATVLDDLGQQVPQAVATWSSSDPSIAGVDSDGRASGFAPGVTVLWASFDGVAGSARMTVTPLACGRDGLEAGARPKKEKKKKDDDEPPCSPPAGTKTR